MSDSDEEYSSFDVDLGGSQRKQLKAEVRQVTGALAASREERDMLETQIEVLQRLQNEAKIATRVGQQQRKGVQPTFSAWRAFIASVRATKAHARTIAEIQEAAVAKAAQAEALEARVARVKGNAQSKLTELSDANKRMAAALEQRDADLKALRVQAKKASAHAAATQAELDAMRARLAEAEAARGFLEVRLESEREAKRAEDMAVGSQRVDLATLLRALATADGELGGAADAVLLYKLQAERQAAQCDGLQAEKACLKAEATARLTLLSDGFGNNGKPNAPATDVGRDNSLLAIGEPILLPTAFGASASAEVVELVRCRRALLSAVFWGWADRVALVRAMTVERESFSRGATLEAEYAQQQSEWEERVRMERAEADQLRAALEDEKAARASVQAQSLALGAELAAAHATAEDAAAAAASRLGEALAGADAAAAAHCVHAAELRGVLMATDDERARLDKVAGQLEAQLRRGEDAMMAIVQSSRQVVETIASPSPVRGTR